jgi:putative ABC transport system permease protein
MKVLKLIFKNSRRHLLRSFLTVIGVAIAVTAFCVIRSAIDAWYLGSQAASPNRLITRNAISLTFNLPLAYKEKILKVPGVVDVSHSTYFGGVYIDAANFFIKFPVDHTNYFSLYPEIVIPPDQWKAFTKERNAVIIGRGLADRFGWELGDQINIIGDIYPGNWNFVIRAIYTAGNDKVDEQTWFSRFDYHDETLREVSPPRAGQVGTFVIKIDDPDKAAQISAAIDKEFVNSLAETKTETEEAFMLSFVAMSSQLILGMRIISYLILGVVLLVLANTMSMAARERIKEYAVIKTLGFRTPHIVGLILGESIFIAMLGGVLGVLLGMAFLPVLETALIAFLPKIPLTALTITLALLASFLVGFIAATFPTLKAVNTKIVDGLRAVE